MCPIYKKKDKDDISNYRPVTVLNTDYKVFTKALAYRLAETAPSVIHRNQAGFLKGRSIFEQVKLAKLAIDYAEEMEDNGALVGLDQEKAYDKISHPYLWEVLKKFNFPIEFIQTIKNLYQDASTVIIINGIISSPFAVIRGVRQGDAMSCLIFDLAIEPLAAALRNSNLRGITIPTTNEKIITTLFADDTTVYMSESDDFNTLQNILDEWCTVSGAKFNIGKTEILPTGSQTYREELRRTRKLNNHSPEFPEGAHIAEEGEAIRMLGAWIGNNINNAEPWGPILEQTITTLDKWERGHPTTEGRRLIAQMSIAGKTQFLTTVQGMPTAIEERLTKIIRTFAWPNDSKSTISLKQLQEEFRNGGRKLLDLEARNKAIHLMWLKEYLNFDDRPAWAYIADELIRRTIPKS